jgi:ribosomal protein S18 acetylase RimI-like enzyme
MQYTLRPATHDDYEFLYNLHATTIRPSVEATWGWDEAFQRAYFADRFDPAQSQIIVVDGEDVGVLQVEERNGQPFLGLIEIAPEYQNRGLGTRVIKDVLDKVHAEGRPLFLHVLKANRDARRLYRRLGFEIVEEREKRYVMLA